MPRPRPSVVKDPAATRNKLLAAAFHEFYLNGFQGGSINHIVAEAGTTKGALFHHFDSKQELGYAVVDEVIGPLLIARWLGPLANQNDPIPVIQRTFRVLSEEDLASGNYVHGCPLNNLAQEMTPLDLGFQRRITHLYDTWRGRYAEALARGKQFRTVLESASEEDVAAMLVAAQMGIWGSAKGSRDPRVVRQAVNAVCQVLQALRP